MSFVSRILVALLLLSYGFFCLLMVQISLQYVSIDTDVAFLRIKQDYTDRLYYSIAFFVHAFAAVLALPAGFTQFSKALRRKNPALHRRAGRVYVWAILLLAAPTGFIIGLHANGGWSSQLAFCLLALGWFWFTWKAVERIKAGDFKGHRDFMIRSFSLTLSAITLRAWKYLIVALWAPRPMDVYRLVAWLGWVLNLIIAELIIFYLQKRKL